MTDTERDWECDKVQFDYAWKWFDFHADQRVKMFNFMLVIFGILATAIFTALKVNRLAAGILCLIATLLALIFSLLDRRNRDLVWLGEDLLAHLETAVIFKHAKEIPCLHGNREDATGKRRNVRCGILSRQSESDADSTKTGLAATIADAMRGKHRVWLRGTAYLLSLFFFVAALLIFFLPSPLNDSPLSDPTAAPSASATSVNGTSAAPNPELRKK